MRAWAPLVLVFSVACNAFVNFGELERTPTVAEELPAPENDAGKNLEDGAVKRPKADASKTPLGCDLAKPFGTPVLLEGPVNSVSAAESSPTLTDDELTIVFSRSISITESRLVTATRTSFDQPFGEPTVVPGLTSTSSFAPTMTGDGLILYWSEQVVNATDLTVTSAKIMAARRSTRAADFGAPEPYRPDENNKIKISPFVSPDATEIYFAQFEASNVIHIYRSKRGELNIYEAAERVDELASSDGSEGGIAMSADGLRIYFASSRAGASGPNDVYTAKRADRASPWTDITRVDELASPTTDRPGWLSPDGCRLYLNSEREPGMGLFVATKPP